MCLRRTAQFKGTALSFTLRILLTSDVRCHPVGHLQLTLRGPPCHLSINPTPHPCEALDDGHHPQFPGTKGWGAGPSPRGGRKGLCCRSRMPVARPASLCSRERSLDKTRGRPVWPFPAGDSVRWRPILGPHTWGCRQFPHLAVNPPPTSFN